MKNSYYKKILINCVEGLENVCLNKYIFKYIYWNYKKKKYKKSIRKSRK